MGSNLGQTLLIPARGASTWTPTAFGSNLLLWFEGDNNSQGDGTAVTSWTDSSGNSRHAVQATGSLQPVYKTGILNGKPVVRFDATDDCLQVPNFTHNISTGDFTVACVVKTPSSLAAAERVWAHYDNSTNVDQFLLNTNFVDFFISGDKVFATTLTTSTWYTLVFGRASGTCSLYLNGTVDANAPASADSILNTCGIVLGASLTGTQPLGSDLAALLWTNTALSGATRAQLQGYWRAKYAHY